MVSNIRFKSKKEDQVSGGGVAVELVQPALDGRDGRVLVGQGSGAIYFENLPASDMWVFINGLVDWEKSIKTWVLYALLTETKHPVVSS